MAMNEKDFNAYRKKAFDFLWDEVEPLGEEIETKGVIPHDILWPKFIDIGFLKMQVPEEYGGLDLSESQYLQFEKEWSKVHGGIRMLLHCINTSYNHLRHARKELQDYYYPKIASGEIIFAFALTEPGAGTGRDIRTRAVKDGSNYVINGVKHLISITDLSDVYVVVCKTEETPGDGKISSIIVEKTRKGFNIVPMKPVMGCVGSFHERVIFDNCVVPVDNLIGEEGKGLDMVLNELRVSRVRIAANALGTIERCLDLSIDYAKKRRTFGKPLAQRQAVQHYLADSAMCVAALQYILEHVTKKIEKGENIDLEANICKLFACEAERRVTDNAMLVFGGIGYTSEYPIERMYREARVNWLEEGTPTIHTAEIARCLLQGQRTYKAYRTEELENSFDKAIKELDPDLQERLKSLIE